jgi:hypothetical protein
LGWRLPTIEELASLVVRTQTNPSLPSGHPFLNAEPYGYWSTTTFDTTSTSEYAWWVSFSLGYPAFNSKNDKHYVRAVRGGHGYNAY